MTFGFALTSTLAGEQVSVSPQMASVMLAAVEAAERELRAAPN
jgi:hypothetical protein